MKKIDLRFGQGLASTFINWKDRCCSVYSGESEFHNQYGGITYYRSRSGLSFAGWIPHKPYIQIGQGYRTDRPTWNNGTAGPYIPFSYREVKLSEDWPVVFPSGPGLPERVALASPNRLYGLDYLFKEDFQRTTLEFEYVYVKTGESPLKKVWRVAIYSIESYSRHRIKTILLRLFGHYMRPTWNNSDNPFWGCMGIRIDGDAAYKIGGYQIPIDWKPINYVLNKSAKEIVEYLGWGTGDCEFVEENTIAAPTPNGFTLFSRFWENSAERYKMLFPYEEIDMRFWYDAAYRQQILDRMIKF